MHIRFGLHLDHGRSWLPRDTLGAVTVGPLGLLGILETHLGLLRNRASHAERVAQYRRCLQLCDRDERFYHRSFAVDDISTAETLLGWSDLWQLHGWNGSVPADASARLVDMAAVEREAVAVVDESVGQRLARVLRALEDRTPPIAEIELHDPIEVFPTRWQQVLARLTVRVATISARPVGDGLLGDLQRALIDLDQGRTASTMQWWDDGTLRVVRAETRTLGARWLAERLRDDSGTTLVVTVGDDTLLDDVLAASGLPRLGLRGDGGARPALQVLPLALSLLWDPLDPIALLQFLTHPVSPLPRYVRAPLAASLARSPGVGGPAWSEALQRIGADDPDKAAAARTGVQRWIGQRRYAADAGAPVVTIIERVDLLARYFHGGLVADDVVRRRAAEAGFDQCRAVAAALRILAAQGVAVLRRPQLERLLSTVDAPGGADPLAQANVGAKLVTDDPATAIEPVDTVYWHPLAMPAMPKAYPWSRRELASLRAADAALPEIDALLAQRSREWMRPILAARRLLVLVLPPPNEEVHPQYLTIDKLVRGLPVEQLDDLLRHGNAAVPPRPLPRRRRWWQLPDGVRVSQPQRASYTSLNLLLNDPCRWVLQYAARLQPSAVLAIPDDVLLFGNLAHRVVERHFRRPDALLQSASALDDWLATVLPGILVEEGAVLLMPGRRTDRERFVANLRSTLQQLQSHLQQAAATLVVPECDLKGTFAGGELVGAADLLVRRGDGREAIIDMKWGGSRYRREALRDNRHLQLAVYAHLVRQSSGHWPEVAFFILRDERLIAPNSAFFPDATIEASASGEGTPELWQRFLATHAWRAGQLERGSVEVVDDDLEATADSMPPADGLAVESLPPQYNDFAHLAGW